MFAKNVARQLSRVLRLDGEILVLPEGGLLESLEYWPPEKPPTIPGLFKRGIENVKCRDQQGRTFIVEMQ